MSRGKNATFKKRSGSKLFKNSLFSIQSKRLQFWRQKGSKLAYYFGAKIDKFDLIKNVAHFACYARKAMLQNETFSGKFQTLL